MGLRSSAYEIDVDLESSPPLLTKILTNDIVVTSSTLGGNSGLFRMWFSFQTAAGADFVVTITKKGGGDLFGSPLIVNGDNSFILKSDGYYRFDIGVRPDDLINLACSQNIVKINEFQIQQIQIGA